MVVVMARACRVFACVCGGVSSISCFRHISLKKKTHQHRDRLTASVSFSTSSPQCDELKQAEWQWFPPVTLMREHRVEMPHMCSDKVQSSIVIRRLCFICLSHYPPETGVWPHYPPPPPQKNPKTKQKRLTKNKALRLKIFIKLQMNANAVLFWICE